MTAPAAPVTPVTPVTPTRTVPGVGWLVLCSLWLLPVLLGFGLTSGLGFGLIGVLVVRLRWVLVAVLYGWLLSWLDTGPDRLLDLVRRVQAGYVDPVQDGPLLVLYLLGVGYALHANRVWLRILWGRRERGERMLGWRPPAPAERPARTTPEPRTGREASPAGMPEQHPPDGSEALAARARLEARAARGFRAVLERDRARALGAFRARLASPEPVPPASVPLTQVPLASPPLVSAPLVSTPLPRTTSLGLPRGPLDPRVATAEELASIPGIGPERAALLVELRAARPLDSVEDVVDALGLAAYEVLRARPYLRF